VVQRQRIGAFTDTLVSVQKKLSSVRDGKSFFGPCEGNLRCEIRCYCGKNRIDVVETDRRFASGYPEGNVDLGERSLAERN